MQYFLTVISSSFPSFYFLHFSFLILVQLGLSGHLHNSQSLKSLMVFSSFIFHYLKVDLISVSMWLLTAVILSLALSTQCFAGTRNLIAINEETWTDLLKGEWMVEL